MKKGIVLVSIVFAFIKCSPTPTVRKPTQPLSKMFMIEREQIEHPVNRTDLSKILSYFDHIDYLIKEYPDDTFRQTAIQFMSKKDSFISLVDKAQRVEMLEKKADLKAARKAYETKLRNHFLDTGVDIKVQVSGKESDNIKLTYILFGDVWSRKFETEGFFTTWTQMGFKSWTLSDGHEYGMTWK